MILRKMQENEAKAVQKLAVKSFWRSLESPFVSRPKTAIIAERDGKIIGGFLYSIEDSGKFKLARGAFLKTRGLSAWALGDLRGPWGLGAC